MHLIWTTYVTCLIYKELFIFQILGDHHVIFIDLLFSQNYTKLQKETLNTTGQAKTMYCFTMYNAQCTV